MKATARQYIAFASTLGGEMDALEVSMAGSLTRKQHAETPLSAKKTGWKWRRAAMHDRYIRSTLSYESVGAEYGVSGGRVRQCIAKLCREGAPHYALGFKSKQAKHNDEKALTDWLNARESAAKG